MPNPSGKMNQREREICARFKIVRERMGQSERTLALLLNVTRDKLAGIEYGRTPLQSGVAFALAKYAGCNLNWLAEGTGPMRGPLPNPDLIAQIPPRCLFSVAWKRHLKIALTPGTKHFGQGWEGIEESLTIGGATALEYSKEEIEGCFKNLPSHLHRKLSENIAKTCRDFVAMNSPKILELNPRDTRAHSIDLTQMSNEHYTGLMHQWPRLKARIQNVTRNPGGKSTLAKALGVDLTQISRWLSRSGPEPGAENTLKMLNWVEYQERIQNKLPRHAVNAPGQKTRKPASYENMSRIK